MIKIFSTRLLLVGLVLSSIFLSSCGTPAEPEIKAVKDFDSKVMQQWNSKYLEIERYAGGYRPGPAPRSLAYIGLACYEACVAGMPEYNSVKGYYSGLNIPEPALNATYHYPTVVNAAYSLLMQQFFTVVPSINISQLSGIATLRDKLNADYQKEIIDGDDVNGKKIFDDSKAYGEAVARAVYEWSKTDAVAHDHHLDPFKDNVGKYKPGTSSGNWVATIPGPAKPMFPDWGYARTFAISESDKLCKKPMPFSEKTNSLFYAQAAQVRAAVNEATPEDRHVAFFWSDDLMNLTFSPGPRLIAVANQVYAKENSNLDIALYTNVKVGMAISDAAVACWYSKYYYNLERPESYIKRVIDPTWEPMLYNPLTGDKGFTPPFPAYPSGHSTMGGAGAAILEEVFGPHYSFTDYCHQGRNDFEGSAPRSYGSFEEMGQEDAISRIALGVHFEIDCTEGIALGKRVARKVNALDWKK